jgi:AbrB family looped-hinge helix DNA binding protein
MQRTFRQPAAAFSRVSANGQTVIPREVREQLRLKPGDILRHRFAEGGIQLDKAAEADGDPFAAFFEWASGADKKAYGGL